MGVKLCILLLHLGACAAPIEWAGAREISPETLAACPHADWRRGMASALKVKIDAPWTDWERAAKKALSGYGSGYGDGYGDGSGAGYGSGDGYGYGDGAGDGDGSGDGYGSGDGSGSG